MQKGRRHLAMAVWSMKRCDITPCSTTNAWQPNLTLEASDEPGAVQTDRFRKASEARESPALARG